MTKNEMINKIYEVIANKELSYGVIFYPDEKSIYDTGESEYVYCPKYKDDNHITITCLGSENWEKTTECFYDFSSDKYIIDGYNIKGHPVMIGDVLDYREIIANTKKQEGRGNGLYWIGDIKTIQLNKKWKNKRKPIEEQSDNCIKYVFDLLNKGEKII